MAFWLFAFVPVIVLYLLPALIGVVRGVDRLALVLLVNLIGAPTGVGWLSAMILVMILVFGPKRVPVPSPGRYPGNAY